MSRTWQTTDRMVYFLWTETKKNPKLLRPASVFQRLFFILYLFKQIFPIARLKMFPHSEHFQ